mmetsp:Transcript_28878/g.52113  ORF Transcript_28878/g.52113 Transcript_28878/m.52113 type:complete len:276 (+) Transcript_28878:2481-3308(+)
MLDGQTATERKLPHRLAREQIKVPRWVQLDPAAAKGTPQIGVEDRHPHQATAAGAQQLRRLSHRCQRIGHMFQRVMEHDEAELTGGLVNRALADGHPMEDGVRRDEGVQPFHGPETTALHCREPMRAGATTDIENPLRRTAQPRVAKIVADLDEIGRHRQHRLKQHGPDRARAQCLAAAVPADQQPLDAGGRGRIDAVPLRVIAWRIVPSKIRWQVLDLQAPALGTQPIVEGLVGPVHHLAQRMDLSGTPPATNAALMDATVRARWRQHRLKQVQ